MAIILSENSEQVVYKTKRIEKGIECDICGKFIEATDKWNRNDITKYFEVCTGHHDWGNDSWESVKNRDVCPDCIEKFVINYLKNCSGTAHIEIKTTHTFPRCHWDD